MSSFFKQLIDIGEEDKSAKAAGSEKELSTMPSQQLVATIRSLRQQIKDSALEYENLRVDSQSLRSEYDAYKQKVEGWQRQMREARASDKRMIEQLRQAGTQGGTDEVFAKNMNDTIARYKEELREANENVAKAFKRQREAEEQRTALEQSKKREIEELWGKFEALKERMKRDATAAPGATAGADGSPSSETERLRERLSFSESSQQSLKARNKALEEEAAALRQVIEKGSATTVDRGGNGGGAEAIEVAGLRRDNATLRAALEQERDAVAQLRSSEAALKEDLRRAEAAAHRKVEDMEWAAIEAEKRTAELRLQLDGANARCVALENRLETKESERLLQEKEMRRALRDAQDELAQDKQRHLDAARQFQEREAALHNELHRAVEQAARTSELAGEAEQLSHRHQSAIEDQRRRYEDHISALERQIRELDANRHRYEAVAQEAKADVRLRDVIVDDLREELDSTTERVSDLEAQAIVHLRTLNAREEELVARERERQQLRQQLLDVEDMVAKHRTKVSEMEATEFDLRRQLSRLETQAAEAGSARDRADAEAEAARRSLRTVQRENEQAGARCSELERHLVERQRLHDDAIKALESAVVRHREEAGSGQRAVAIPMEGAAPAALLAPSPPSQTLGALPPDPVLAASGGYAARRSRLAPQPQPVVFPGERDNPPIAVTLKRISWNQWKLIAAAAVLLLVVVSLINSSTMAPVAKAMDAESLAVLREKYDQVQASLLACKEQLVLKR